MKIVAGNRTVMSLVSACLLFAAWPQNDLDAQGAPQGAPDSAAQNAPTDGPAATSQPTYTQRTPGQLQRLVAPIALYPDSLVAQILAASTFPEQVVEADRWVQANVSLQGEALGKAVDSQPWDPSVKALTAFPSVLGNMDKNLSWASSLGDAYFNQQADVMSALQVMRQRAQAAGNLKTTSQQTVATQDSSLVIAPVSPEVVYVPAYDPWLAYGDPILAWPGWYPYPGVWFDGPSLALGIGFGIGFYGGFGWGWGNWGFDWRHGYSEYGHSRYYSRSSTFYNRNSYYRGGGARGVQSSVSRGMSGNRLASAGRAGDSGRSSESRGSAGTARGGRATASGGRSDAARGYAEPRGESGVRSGAFSGYDRGGEVRGYSSRGNSSVGASQGGAESHGGGSTGHATGGGGGSHGGGGGGGGGGGHGGGGRSR